MFTRVDLAENRRCANSLTGMDEKRGERLFKGCRREILAGSPGRFPFAGLKGLAIQFYLLRQTNVADTA